MSDLLLLLLKICLKYSQGTNSMSQEHDLLVPGIQKLTLTLTIYIYMYEYIKSLLIK